MVHKRKSDFQSKFNLNEIEVVNQLLDTLVDNNTNQNVVDDIVKKISDIPILAGIETGMSKQATSNNTTPRPKKQSQPWFDHDCRMKKSNFPDLKTDIKIERLLKIKKP